MKHLLIIGLLACSMNAAAQPELYFKSDVGLHYAGSSGKLRTHGGGASVEPKLFIGPTIAVGARLEATVLFGGKLLGDSEDISVGMSTRASQLFKAEYYITKGATRPFVGFGLGRYVMANIGASGAGEASISAGAYFGMAPQIGITLGNFRISGMYNIVSGQDIIQTSVGSVDEVSRNYMVIEIGFKAFGYNDPDPGDLKDL